MAGISQDWEPVVIRKKAPTAAARKDEKAVNAARRSGAEIETIRKGIILYFMCCVLYYMYVSVCMFLLIFFIEVLVDDSIREMFFPFLFSCNPSSLC